MNKAFIVYNAKILVRGLVRVIWGSLNAWLVGLAIYGFVVIPNEGGYIAVCEFIGAVCLVLVAFCSIYLLGIGSFQKPRKCAGGR